MENSRDRNSTPPQVRLPEPPVQMEENKTSLTRRELLITIVAGVLICALSVWFIVFVISAGRTPQQAVDRYVEEDMKVEEEVIHISLLGETSRSVYFYTTGDTMSCALLEQKASGYSVLDVAGHLPLNAPDKQGIWKMLGSDRRETFVFGILYNPALKSVQVDGMPAVIVNTGTYRCWYYYAEGNASINSESVVYM